jgi:phosphoribosylaminoimidazole (AIR) synthetase
VLPHNAAVRIDLARIPVPPVFSWLAARGAIPQAEMLRTFNCGVGMVMIVAAGAAAAIAARLTEGGETVLDIGRVEPRDAGPVVYDGALGPGAG